MMVPIAFTSDHIETLHEMDLEYAEELGKEVWSQTLPTCYPILLFSCSCFVSLFTFEARLALGAGLVRKTLH